MNIIRLTARIRAFDIFLVVVMSLFCFSCLFTMFYHQNVNHIQKLSNNFYDEDSLFFRTSQANFDFTSLYDSLPHNSVLFSKFFGRGEDIRGVVYKGSYASPNITSGRFFEETDFTSNAHLAVIGKDVPIRKTVHNKKMIEFNNLNYEVIGTIGYNLPTRMDRTILLNLNADNITSSVEYIVSSSSVQDSFNFIGNENMFGQVTLFERENVNILHLVDQGNRQLITSIIFIFILLVNSLSVLIFWIEKKNNEMRIKWNNGYSKRKIIIDNWKDFAPLLSTALVLAICSSWFIGGYLQSIHVSVLHTLVGMIILFCSFSLSVIFISYRKLA
ncbi:ABC transporter permease [Paenibacillus amylolyticus]|uniref:ABC transporter permease n=1 Tax=Paenibacillus amylolyticus TaxID=1451 RepID=UPI00201E4A49|nr:ABC transporter permease [Paenibacillus amylolyticus]MCL6660399.1 ABC transporter permease [Paenibacillus amylolyticus]